MYFVHEPVLYSYVLCLSFYKLIVKRHEDEEEPVYELVSRFRSARVT